ncbi:hypothetical protein GW766_00780 [Candidatus Parcubacteria bacterium]|nr:hypothetical protein [Candidatus Parcubacteria bacterium]
MRIGEEVKKAVGEKTTWIAQANKPFTALGACTNCPKYRVFRSHELCGGHIRISCEGAGGMVTVKITLASYEECEYYQRSPRTTY